MLKHLFYFQSKKALKRKADTSLVNANAVHDTGYKMGRDRSSIPATPLPHTPSQPQMNAMAIGSGRRESSRQIKKPRKDLLEESSQHATGGKSRKRPASAQLKYCHNLIKELLGHKKHNVRANAGHGLCFGLRSEWLRYGYACRVTRGRSISQSMRKRSSCMTTMTSLKNRWI